MAWTRVTHRQLSCLFPESKNSHPATSDASVSSSASSLPPFGGLMLIHIKGGKNFLYLPRPSSPFCVNRWRVWRQGGSASRRAWWSRRRGR